MRRPGGGGKEEGSVMSKTSKSIKAALRNNTDKGIAFIKGRLETLWSTMKSTPLVMRDFSTSLIGLCFRKKGNDFEKRRHVTGLWKQDVKVAWNLVLTSHSHRVPPLSRLRLSTCGNFVDCTLPLGFKGFSHFLGAKRSRQRVWLFLIFWQTFWKKVRLQRTALSVILGKAGGAQCEMK